MVGYGSNPEFIDTKDALETMNEIAYRKIKENQAPLFLEFPTYRHRALDQILMIN